MKNVELKGEVELSVSRIIGVPPVIQTYFVEYFGWLPENKTLSNNSVKRGSVIEGIYSVKPKLCKKKRTCKNRIGCIPLSL